MLLTVIGRKKNHERGNVSRSWKQRSLIEVLLTLNKRTAMITSTTWEH